MRRIVAMSNQENSNNVSMAAKIANEAADLLREWKPSEASIKAKEALILNPQNALALQIHGTISCMLMNYDDALEAYQKLIKLEPDEWTHWEAVGDIYFDTERFNDAKAAFQRALLLSPDSVKVHCKQAKTLKELSEPLDEAIWHIEQAMRIPSPTSEDLSFLILTLLLFELDEEIPQFLEKLEKLDQAKAREIQNNLFLFSNLPN